MRLLLGVRWLGKVYYRGSLWRTENTQLYWYITAMLLVLVYVSVLYRKKLGRSHISKDWYLNSLMFWNIPWYHPGLQSLTPLPLSFLITLGELLGLPFASVFSSGTWSYHYLIYMPSFHVLAISMCSTTKAIQLEIRHMGMDISAFNIVSIQIDLKAGFMYVHRQSQWKCASPLTFRKTYKLKF